MLRIMLVVTLVALASTPLPVAAQAGAAPTDAAPFAGSASNACASGLLNPPCGEINPRIILQFPEIDPSAPVALAPGQTLEFPGTLTFTFNAGDEGYVPEDPNSPIGVSFSFPRRPLWAEPSMEPSRIELSPLNPVHLEPGLDDPTAPTLVYTQTFDILLTVKAIDIPTPTPGYPYAKLQLFAKSSESGIYNPGYGVKELRVQTDPGLVGATPDDDTDAVPAPASLVALAAALAALAMRRRR